MDFVPETLYRVLKFYNKMKQPFPNILVKLYSYQMFRSLAYIHGIGICHRDIKPQNLLVDPATHILKLCDFGSAKRLIVGKSCIFPSDFRGAKCRLYLLSILSSSRTDIRCY